MTQREHIKELVAAANALFAWYDGERDGYFDYSHFFPGAAAVVGFTRLRTAVIRVNNPKLKPRSASLPEDIRATGDVTDLQLNSVPSAGVTQLRMEL